MHHTLPVQAIFANCVTLAMASSKPGFEESSLGQSLTIANYVFVALFALEALIKIIALGFMFSPHTYLRNGALAECCSIELADRKHGYTGGRHPIGRASHRVCIPAWSPRQPQPPWLVSGLT